MLLQVQTGRNNRTDLLRGTERKWDAERDKRREQAREEGEGGSSS